MGYFLKGYEVGTSDGLTEEKIKEKFKEVVINGTYGDCVEWYNGLYKGELDYALYWLKEAFEQLKDKKETK